MDYSYNPIGLLLLEINKSEIINIRISIVKKFFFGDF